MSFPFQRNFLFPLALLLIVPPVAAQFNEQCNDKGKSVPANPNLTIQAASDRQCARVRSSYRYTKSQPYDIASGTYTGDTRRGPTIIKAINLNTIRYDYQFGSAVTIATAPNVWTGLTALATTNAGSTPKAPADKSPAQAADPLESAAAASPAPTKRGGVGSQNSLPHDRAQIAADPFDPVNQVIAAIKPILEKFTTSQHDYNSEMDGYSKVIESLNGHVQVLRDNQDGANRALGLVVQSGSALTVYLNSPLRTSVDLIQATQTQLRADSVFVAGATAEWPSPAIVAGIQHDLADDSKNLTSANAKLTGYAPAELIALKAIEASMIVQLSRLQAVEKTYESTAKPVIKAHEDSEAAVEQELQTKISLVQADEAFLNALPAQLTAAVAQNAAAVTAVAALAPGSTSYANFVSAREALRGWRDKMTSTNQKYLDFTTGRSAIDPFSLSRPADCGFAFSSTKDTVVTLTRVDLTPGLVNPTAQPVLSVTVECTSPFTLSAGVAFSTIADPEYKLTVTTPATSTTPAVDSITLVSTSHFHPLPLALASMRVWEPNERVAMYASFGVAANIRAQSSGGSTAEYLLGPTIGFFRTFLITPGVHFGSEPRIADPYTLNGTVPSSVSSVPITTHYRPAFGLGITFTVPK